MSSSKRSSILGLLIDPPPYNSTGTRPPSFQSSPPRSIQEADPPEIEAVSDTKFSKFPKSVSKDKESGPKKLLKPIPEQPEPVKSETGVVGETEDSGMCCGCEWSCIVNHPRRGCLIAVVVVVIVLAGLGTALGLVLPRGHGNPINGNSTATATVTSTAHSTQVVSSTSILHSTVTSTVPAAVTTSTSSSATPISTPFYLGGFDAVAIDNVQHLVYTDQQGSIQHIEYTSDWVKANPGAIVSGVRPGSPVSASAVVGSYSSEAHVFYVDTASTIQGIIGQFPYGSSFSSDYWLISSVGSLALRVSDSMFIRSCVPDSSSYTYWNNADLYLYFASPGGVIRKFGWWNANSSAAATWQQLEDLPPVKIVGEVECEFMAGVETLWIVNDGGNVEQWWRSYESGTDWTQGIQGSDRVFPNASLLSISSGESARSHIMFQAADLNLMRYDISGIGDNATHDHTEVAFPGTPGTRLTTYANIGYCQTQVAVYYQRDKTSDLHYLQFQDRCTYDNGCSVAEGSHGDQIMPLVRSYGKDVKHHHKIRGWAAFGVFVGAVAALIVLGGCVGAAGS